MDWLNPALSPADRVSRASLVSRAPGHADLRGTGHLPPATTQTGDGHQAGNARRGGGGHDFA